MITRKVFLILLITVFSNTVFASGIVGKDAPDITIRQWVTPNPPDIKNLKNRVYVVEFWATWCRPCITGIDHLNELNNKYKDAGLEFISLCADRAADNTRRVVAEKKINYHVAMDNGTADWFGVRGYPTAAVVNHLGKVTWFGHPADPSFERAIIEALEQGPPPLLTGIDLGTFESLRKGLSGGKNFADAYNRVSSYKTNKTDPSRTDNAALIISTIDNRIDEKIKTAQAIQADDPVEAFGIYAGLVSRYSGIEAVIPAQQAVAKLKKSEEFQKILLAAQSRPKRHD